MNQKRTLGLLNGMIVQNPNGIKFLGGDSRLTVIKGRVVEKRGSNVGSREWHTILVPSLRSSGTGGRNFENGKEVGVKGNREQEGNQKKGSSALSPEHSETEAHKRQKVYEREPISPHRKTGRVGGWGREGQWIRNANAPDWNMKTPSARSLSRLRRLRGWDSKMGTPITYPNRV